VKTSEMTDEALRIRVAELLGKTVALMMYDWKEQIPDYPHDLNACHKMEKALPKSERMAYEAHLLLVINGRGLSDNNRHWQTLHAAARQRCIAFVSVMEAK